MPVTAWRRMAITCSRRGPGVSRRPCCAIDVPGFFGDAEAQGIPGSPRLWTRAPAGARVASPDAGWHHLGVNVHEVLRVLDHLTAAGIRVWVDGGWGVDALVGQQTRHHADLDLALPLVDGDRALRGLAALDYHVVNDELPTRVDLWADDDRQVDLHPLVFDTNGNGLQQLQDGSFGTYGADGLRGEGRIAERRVACLTPDLQIRFHRGYTPDDDDRHDVRLLAERFDLPLPPEYQDTPR